jgi:basic membrane lipoprotein Med (substrate-binding protein (PBP1-ABC) superfamily)
LTFFLIISCHARETGSPQNTSFPEQKKINFKVAALIPRNSQTDAWSMASYQGLMAIERQLGVQISYQDNVDIPSPQPHSRFEKILREYAQEGNDLIIGHGRMFVESIETVAKEFPRTKFAVISAYRGNQNNVVGVTYRSSEAGYLVGVAGALATKKNKIAFIGGQPHLQSQEVAKFCEKGAKSINPSIDISKNWVGNFTDEKKAKELAESAISSGADVLILNAGGIEPVIISLADQVGVKVIGSHRDQYELAPKIVLTNMITKFGEIYLQAVTLAMKGQWEGKLYQFGLKEGAIEMSSSHGNLTTEQEVKLRNIIEDIKLGRLNILS